MIVDCAATKTNLIKFKKSYSFTQEGYELLEEKRRILMIELTSFLYVVEKMESDADKVFKEAYETIDKAVIFEGKKHLEELAIAINIKNKLSISAKRVMGVELPVVNFTISDNSPYCSSVGVSLYVEEAIAKFKSILPLLAQLAEKRIALLRLTREIQKTIRKVNALEKIYLPFYKNAVKYIGERLDEESRESFSMLKLIKKRLKG